MSGVRHHLSGAKSELTSELLQFRSMPYQANEEKPIELIMYLLIKDNSLETCYPNIEIALQIYLTLMVTNCTGERSFSKLKRVKNELNSHNNGPRSVK
jgi:hypothetical protein